MSAAAIAAKASLALLGLVLGAVAGLFVADWLGWVPQITC